MKKLLVFTALAATVAFTSCSKDDDNVGSCEENKAKFEAVEELTCENIKLLENVRKSCGDENGEIAASIALIKSFCP